MDEGSVTSEPSRERDRPYGCAQCDKAFGRLTHLRRHEQSHVQGDHSHQCVICNKSFARLDSLKRHSLTHQDPQRQGGVKVPKACVHCVAAKTKCTGEHPCRRCDGKALDCNYASPGSLNEAQCESGENDQHRDAQSHDSQPVDMSPPNLISWMDVGQGAHSNQMNLDFTLPPMAVAPSTMSAQFYLSPNNLQSPNVTASPNVDTSVFDSGTPVGSTSLVINDRTARYYVEGSGSRQSRVKRRRLTVDESHTPPADIFNEDHQRYALPDMPAPITAKSFINDDMYMQLCQSYQDTCVSSWFQSRFESEILPSRELINYLIDQYFDHFNPLMPILHVPTMQLSHTHWILPLALATAGAQFSSNSDLRPLAISFQEFLRRCLLLLSNPDLYYRCAPQELELTQARLLGHVCMMYSGNKRFVREAKKERSVLCDFCKETWTSSEDNSELQANPSFWTRWAHRESLRRTGYGIWLVDAMLAYQFDMTPLLSLEHATVAMPCQEVVFEAKSATEWSELYKMSTPMPTLVAASEALYVKKYIHPTAGEFSRVLLIHAVFQRTWDVERYVRQPLSHYVPFSGQDGMQDSPSGTERWLPGIPLFGAWRNAACDCLDVLHWSANSVIGAASGMEHPTVLHLHLARIVLLTPYESISKLAFHRAGLQPFSSATDEAKTRREIHKWLQHDQYKARLAMIHAGVLFWHVGRYSAAGFYEPAAIFLASLVLWSYSTFQWPQGTETNGDDSSSDTDSGRPVVINLDRPSDDELVQSFVKHGKSMRAFLTGVGDLSEPTGPIRIAERGERILRTLTSWGCSWPYIQVLGHLARETRSGQNGHQWMSSRPSSVGQCIMASAA
ncbi:hypothetical protein EJ05DRAFT_324090 [Pseudovirgaria hyperparasitica]|uniref:C2H2 type zinc finger domain protein n=1 Tax=Pseudovirgaria hyperparasitica TaxID=470096 RepID=A0A6A6WAJ0_9PEZI|nr:uncharacterized protein EJ05DRAFT_324090 [Pseudovirgaria hyperparasitica]KAF2758846.1 hypothetical protein EJ05DRAFT_324090 [Pseudovirgaria hyperparasitica]